MVYNPFVGDLNAGGGGGDRSILCIANLTDISSPFSSYTINASKFTIGYTFKRINSGASFYPLRADNPNRLFAGFQSGDDMRFTVQQTGGVSSVEQTTTATFTDTADWHVGMHHFDGSNVTAGDRAKMFHDGVEITAFDSDITTGGDFADDFGEFSVICGNNANFMVFQCALWSNVLLSASDLYDTGSGKPKDFRSVSDDPALFYMGQSDGTILDMAIDALWTQNGRAFIVDDVPELA